MIVLMLTALGLAAVAAAVFVFGVRRVQKETFDASSVRNDVSAVVDEIKKLYDEKAQLVRENDRLKAEIERLKRS